MDYCRRRLIALIICIFCLITSQVHSNEFYNSLVDDLLNICTYGYKGINLETGEINFINYTGPEGYILVSNDTSFYIQSYKGFFKVLNDNNEVFYTRNGEFIKRGNDYYLAYEDYKLATEIIKNDQTDVVTTIIYHPKASSQIKRNGCLFLFTEVECFEEEIIPNRLEIPNVDAIQILLKMQLILKDDSERYSIKLEIINRMLDNLISDKMHEYYIRRSFTQFDLEKYQLSNNQISLDQLNFLYSTNWVRTFSKYIKMLYIDE